MHMRNWLFVAASLLFATHATAQSLPKVTGLALEGDLVTWDAQEGATGYNIHRNYDYFDTVRGGESYTVSEPGRYHVISFNDAGEFGVTRTPEEGGQEYTSVRFMVEAVTTLPKVVGLALEGDQMTWEAQEGATGYNIQRNYRYYDTVRGPLSYTLTEPGEYHVVSFNDMGMFGVTRDPSGPGREYVFVTFPAP